MKDAKGLYKQEVTVTFAVLFPAYPEEDAESLLTWDELGEAAIKAVAADVAANGWKNATEVYAQRGPGGRGLFTDVAAITRLVVGKHIVGTRPDERGIKECEAERLGVSVEATCAVCGDQFDAPSGEDPADTLCVGCAEDEEGEA